MKILKFNEAKFVEKNSDTTESNNIYISFKYNNEYINIENSTPTKVYTDLMEWLYKNGYPFTGKIHSTKTRKIYSKEEIEKENLPINKFHNIGNTGRFMPKSSLFLGGNVEIKLFNMIKLLEEFGIDKSTITHSGFGDKKNEISDDIQDVSDEDDNKTIEKKMTFLFACQFVLKQNDNRPMNSHEIFEEIKKKNLVNTNGLTPQATINAQMILYSINTIAKNKKKNSIFQIIEGTKPYKFILLNPDNIQNVPDEDLEDEDLENLEDDLDNFEIHRFSNFNKSNFKASQSQEEVESIDFNKNPFGGVKDSSAICILGKSGSGKSTSTEIALEKMGHEYELMLAIDGEYTFSQYNGQNFEMSSFGEFLMRAQNDPKRCYTAIFDECHRPITINKINTDLLQALSRKRNRDGKRFITMDRSTKRMYTTPNEEFPIALTDERGKILIPDNFGIICLSSNAAIICRNDDFLNRVDLIIFHQSDRDIKDLTQLKKLDPNDKNIETIRGLLLNDGKSEL